MPRNTANQCPDGLPEAIHALGKVQRNLKLIIENGLRGTSAQEVAKGALKDLSAAIGVLSRIVDGTREGRGS
jgi:hypothetical protein